MRKFLFSCIAFLTVFMILRIASAQTDIEDSTREVDRSVREEVESQIEAFPEKPKIKMEEGAPEDSVRYKVEMRNLDREYQEGSLTRTEYIQRKRLIMKEEQ